MALWLKWDGVVRWDLKTRDSLLLEDIMEKIMCVYVCVVYGIPLPQFLVGREVQSVGAAGELYDHQDGALVLKQTDPKCKVSTLYFECVAL